MGTLVQMFTIEGVADVTRVMIRARLIIDSETFVLAPATDVEDLKQQVRERANGNADFIEFVAAGNELVSALVTPASRVTISVSTSSFEDHDEPVSFASPNIGLRDYDL
ncbi:hypothetical protein [Microbacterium oxydans]|uniref:hypothetical protein n=1 Tax=Microbacterium oxydans TaxID=82380 RepID=UPI000FDAA717|nr:hypothetical protein [Microbacterium oxydans]